MQLTCTAWVESLKTSDDGRGKTYRSCQKHQSLSQHELLSTGRHLLRVSFIIRLKSHLCTALTTQNTTETNGIISHAQNTTARQPNIFLTGIHQILVTNKGRSALLSANNFQGHLQTSQSVLVRTFWDLRFWQQRIWSVPFSGMWRCPAVWRTGTIISLLPWRMFLHGLYYTPEGSSCTFILYRGRVVTMLISSVSKICFVHWTC
jgi:hypothetical protein